jgi:hypothetical protein
MLNVGDVGVVAEEGCDRRGTAAVEITLSMNGSMGRPLACSRVYSESTSESGSDAAYMLGLLGAMEGLARWAEEFSLGS